MKYGVTLPNQGDGIDAEAIADLGKAAEEAGWDGVFVWDAIFGVDPWIALTALALRTERIRLGTLVTPVPRRRPWTLAVQTATLDRLAGGRLILPVGLGAEERNWEKVGEEGDVKLKARRLDEGIAVVTGLWTGQPFSYAGPYYRVDDVTISPTPAQSPRIPIWVPGSWPKPPATQLRRMLRWDGVLCGPDTDIRAMRAHLVEHRSATTALDVIAEDETPGDDRARAAAIVHPLTEAGLTWWLEAVWKTPESEGGVAGMRARIRQGPPREN
jgi:alkanesulfonate monooxygenase SsuD/methylene tetrahydromethanopterin reductase-like flavin-dependent oxidoreductase (luciferase family)